MLIYHSGITTSTGKYLRFVQKQERKCDTWVEYQHSVNSLATMAYNLQTTAFFFLFLTKNAASSLFPSGSQLPLTWLTADFCSYVLPDGSESLTDLTHHKPSGVKDRQATLR